MNPTLEIDHSLTTRAGHHPETEAGAGWDNGELIATTAPRDDDDASDNEQRREIIARLLQLLSSGKGDTNSLGRRLLVVAYLSGSLPDCRTHSQLAKRLKISPGRVTQIISEIKSVLPSLAKCRNRQREKS